MTISISDERLANIEQYKALAAEVVKVAADDYIWAIRSGNDSEVSRIERFFRGPNFALFTDNLDPEYLIEKIRATTKIKRRSTTYAKSRRIQR